MTPRYICWLVHLLLLEEDGSVLYKKNCPAQIGPDASFICRKLAKTYFRVVFCAVVLFLVVMVTRLLVANIDLIGRH